MPDTQLAPAYTKAAGTFADRYIFKLALSVGGTLMLNVFLAISLTALQIVGGFTPVALHSTVVTSATGPAVQSTTSYSSRFRIDGAVEHPTVYTLGKMLLFVPFFRSDSVG